MRIHYNRLVFLRLFRWNIKCALGKESVRTLPTVMVYSPEQNNPENTLLSPSKKNTQAIAFSVAVPLIFFILFFISWFCIFLVFPPFIMRNSAGISMKLHDEFPAPGNYICSIETDALLWMGWWTKDGDTRTHTPKCTTRVESEVLHQALVFMVSIFSHSNIYSVLVHLNIHDCLVSNTMCQVSASGIIRCWMNSDYVWWSILHKVD